MTQYIQKNALVAKIKERYECWRKKEFNFHSLESEIRMSECQHLMLILNTLEVKEVNLEKELDSMITPELKFHKALPSLFDVAKHFFELGMQAQFDKELVEEIYSHIDSIKDTADRMTSGNFMHNRAAIKFSANTIAKVLELMGLKAKEREKV